MENKVKWIMVLIILASIFTWAVVRHKEKKPQVTTKTLSGQTYNVGVILPMTGDAAPYGEALGKVILLAEEEINADGGANGSKLDFLIEDGKCSGKDAATAAQKLIDIDHVQAIIGGFCSGETLAAVPIAEAKKVVLLSAGSTSPKLTNISPYFFRNIASDASQGSLDAEVARQRGYKTVGVLQEQTDYALGIYNVFEGKFMSLGGKAIREEYPTSAADFRTQLIKLKSQDLDALFLITQTSAAAEKILNQLKDLAWRPQLFIVETVAGDAKFLLANKEILEGAIGAEPQVDASNIKFQHFLQAYKQKYGADMPYPSFGQNIYDAVYLLKDGIADVGYNGEKLARWSRTIKNWPGASGQVSIEMNGDRKTGYVSEIVKDGRVQLYNGNN